MPVNFFRIDGSFVKGALHDPIDREVLRGLGVDYAQGYGVSQPQKVQRAAFA